MSDINTLVNQYYLSIMNAYTYNRTEETRRILNEIENLVYERTDKKISLKHKIEIIKKLKTKLAPYEYKQYSNSEYLQLIQITLAQLEAQESQQSNSSTSDSEE